MATVGIVGGHGATGRVVARELLERTDARLLVGSRRLDRAGELAASLGARAAPRRVDVDDPRSVAELCAESDVVVNCAAPCSAVAAKVALPCADQGRHYVDPGLYAVLDPFLAAREDELRRRGLCFVSSAGEFPGLTEIVPLYAAARARESLDDVDGVSVYAADRNEWSPAAVRDILWSIGHSDEPGVFRDGEWRPFSSVASIRTFRFPAPVGRALVVPHFKPELRRFAADHRYGTVAAYVGGYTLRTLLLFARARVQLWRRFRREEHAALKIGAALRRDARRRGHGLAIVGVVRGRSRGRRRTLIASVSERRPVGYRITGVMAATATRMVLDGRVAGAGHRPLCDAVDPTELVAEVARAGVRVELGERIPA